jgi:hypothetical protein
MFGKLEQVFCKWFWTVKNDEEAYMQLRNIQQQIAKCVEAYYEQLFKLTYSLKKWMFLPHPCKSY